MNELIYHECRFLFNCSESVRLPDYLIINITTLDKMDFSLTIKPVNRNHPTMTFTSLDGTMDMTIISDILNKIFDDQYIFNSASYGQTKGICLSWFQKDDIAFNIPPGTIISANYLVPIAKYNGKLTILKNYFESEYDISAVSFKNINNCNFIDPIDGIDIQI